MKRNRFFGKYYKYISSDGYTIAVILSTANEGDMAQVITRDGAYFIDNPHDIYVDDNKMVFNVHQKDVQIEGTLEMGELHPLRKKVMGIFSYLPLECKHEIYSMFHQVNGTLLINKKEIIFNNSRGYIEGDEGVNFPTKYIWYNSVLEETTVTMAIAIIPLLWGLIKFKGLLCFIKNKDEEYYLCTYNGGKIISHSEKEIIIRKGKYQLTLSISSLAGHDLKAPVKGNMSRYIKENINIHTRYVFKHKDQILLENDDPLSSLEYMF